MADDTTPAGAGAPTDQQPQQGNTTTPTTPAPGDAGNDVKNPEAKKYADEAAAERRARKAAEAKLAQYDEERKQAELAKLGETERLSKQYSELQAKHEALTGENRQNRMRWSALEEGAALGLSTPKAIDAALKLADLSAVTFDDAGAPTNLAKVLAETVKEYPFLAASAGQQQTQQRPPATSGGATNPGRQAGNGGLTLEMIKAMTNKERVARISEIKAWEQAQQQTR